MNTNVIATNDLIAQSEGHLVSDMNGEKVMLSIENGKYYNLGHIGGRIWELIANPASIEAVVEQLVAEYNISQEDCEQQVNSFLSQLSSEGLIQVRKE